jgi:transposase
MSIRDREHDTRFLRNLPDAKLAARAGAPIEGRSMRGAYPSVPRAIGLTGTHAGLRPEPTSGPTVHYVSQFGGLLTMKATSIATAAFCINELTLPPLKRFSGAMADGLCVFSKRLESGHFVWPEADSGKIHLTQPRLSMLLEGINRKQPSPTRTPLSML